MLDRESHPAHCLIQLEGDRTVAMKDAVAQMTDHCGGDNFTIVQEGEEGRGRH